MKIFKTSLWIAGAITLGSLNNRCWSQTEEYETRQVEDASYPELNGEHAAAAINHFLTDDAVVVKALRKPQGTEFKANKTERDIFIALLTSDLVQLIQQLGVSGDDAAIIQNHAADVRKDLLIRAHKEGGYSPGATKVDEKEVEKNIPTMGIGGEEGSVFDEYQQPANSQDPMVLENSPIPTDQNTTVVQGVSKPRPPRVIFGLGGWSHAEGKIIHANGTEFTVEVPIPKVIPHPQRFGYIGVQGDLFIGSKSGQGTTAYRSPNFVYTDVQTSIVDGSQTPDYYKDWHQITTRDGSAIYPIAQVNYHAPTVLKRIEPYFGVIFAYGTQNNSLSVYNQLEEHIYTNDLCTDANGNIYDCSGWSTNVLEKNLVSREPGSKWSGFIPGIDAGISTILFKTSGKTALALQTGYERYFDSTNHVGNTNAVKVGINLRIK